MMTTATKNFRIGLLTLVIAVMATLADPGFVQGESTPGTPGNLTVTVGDTEAKIAWEAPAAGDCAVTEYEVEVHQARELIRASQAMTVTDWTLDGLTANTTYRATVISYGESCDDYSDSAEQNFTTNASSGPGDPMRNDNEAKYIQAPPSGVMITRHGTSGIRVAWTQLPTPANTCSPSEYSVRLYKDGTRVGKADEITTTYWDFENAYTADARYTAKIESYSDACNEYSDRAARLSTNVR